MGSSFLGLVLGTEVVLLVVELLGGFWSVFVCARRPWATQIIKSPSRIAFFISGTSTFVFR